EHVAAERRVHGGPLALLGVVVELLDRVLVDTEIGEVGRVVLIGVVLVGVVLGGLEGLGLLGLRGGLVGSILVGRRGLRDDGRERRDGGDDLLVLRSRRSFVGRGFRCLV